MDGTATADRADDADALQRRFSQIKKYNYCLKSLESQIKNPFKSALPIGICVICVP
jgi:hypothetical protein